jgi:hypothetical protein
MATYVEKLLRLVVSGKRAFLLSQIIIFVGCNRVLSQSYTFHTETDLVYKDHNKNIVKYYVYN